MNQRAWRIYLLLFLISTTVVGGVLLITRSAFAAPLWQAPTWTPTSTVTSAPTITPTATSTPLPTTTPMGTRIQLQPTQFTYVQQDDATPHAADPIVLVALRDNTPIARTLVQYDMATLIAGYVDKAYLHYYVSDGAFPSTVLVCAADITWDGATLIWATEPQPACSGDAASSVISATGWVSTNVTSIIRAQVAITGTNYGLVLSLATPTP